MHSQRRVYRFSSTCHRFGGELESILAYCTLVDKPPLYFAILSLIVDMEPTFEGLYQAFTSQLDTSQPGFESVLLYADVWMPLSDFSRKTVDQMVQQMISAGLVCISTGVGADQSEPDVVVLYKYPLRSPGRLQLTAAGAAEWLPFESGVLTRYVDETVGMWEHRKVLISNRAFFNDCPFGRPCSLFPESTDTEFSGKCWSQVVPRWKSADWRDVQVGYMTVCVATHNSVYADFPSIFAISSNKPDFWYELLAEP